MPTHSEQLDALHNFGNTCYAKEKFAAAIEAYSECICLAPMPVYYTNRANCYLKKRAFGAAATDCESALRLLGSGQAKERIKAFYFLGKARTEQRDWAGSIAALATAHSLCKEETVPFRDDIRAALLSARCAACRLPCAGGSLPCAGGMASSHPVIRLSVQLGSAHGSTRWTRTRRPSLR